jgi:hypothetical protein
MTDQTAGLYRLISLQPRYRRLLTVGALLDESIQLFREHWLTLALYSLIALVPSWVVLTLSFVVGARSAFANPGAELPSVEQWIALFGATLLQAVFGLLWSAASTAAAATYMGGGEPTVSGVYKLALRRLPALLLGTLIFIVLFFILSIASTALFVVTLFGTLGTLIALVGLIYWWVKPEGRRPWLKWLIILTSPYGLVTYYFVRWSLFVPAIVLEGEGPLAAMRRSSRLVEHEWFRTGAVLTLAGLILAVLTAVPLTLVGLVIGLLGLNGTFLEGDGTGSLITNSLTVVVQVLFSSIGTIAYLLLFVDLRNRREGTDLGERISSLEATTA